MINQEEEFKEIEEEEFKKILLVLTNKCMLSCDYCEASKNDLSMSENVLEKTFALLADFYKEKPIDIMFFGGEPLMEFPLIRKAISICRKLDNIQRYNFSIFTNGVLLNKIDLKFLARNNVSLIISIDGDRETMAIHRKKGAINPYNNIINALPKLKLLGIRFKAEVTVTPLTVNKLYDNYLHLVDLGFESITLVPVCCIESDRFQWSQSALRIFKKELNKISKIYLKNTKYRRLGNLLIYRNQLKTGLNFIELNDWRMSVNVDGNIYIGDSFLVLDESQRKKLKIGDIRKIKSSKILEKLYKKYIENKKNFLSHIRKNPFVTKYSNQATLKILNEQMAQLDKLIKQNRIRELRRSIQTRKIKF